jgi:2-C-methyl-D-erythritol 2,4-cyclodiphosphate synthase
MRIGFGYDIHRLVPGRRLLLAGVDIPGPIGPEAHSDGDALIHALIDALLGACALGDIGRLFPPEDERYRDISSRLLLRRTLEAIKEAGFKAHNADCTVILQTPRLHPYIETMRENLSADLEIPPSAVSVKAKTGEGLGETGRGRAVEAYAVVTVENVLRRGKGG